MRWGPAAGDPIREAAGIRDDVSGISISWDDPQAPGCGHNANAHLKSTGLGALVAILRAALENSVACWVIRRSTGAAFGL
jgi:hypothetical protein